MDVKAPAFSAYQKSMGVSTSSDKQGISGFEQMLSNSIDNTVSSVNNAEASGNALLIDKMSLEELAMAVNDAEMTLKTVVAVRDKIIGAYQDIIKMPV